MIIATELPCAIGAIFFRRDFQLVALFVLQIIEYEPSDKVRSGAT
jgi:hypothetical protein